MSVSLSAALTRRTASVAIAVLVLLPGALAVATTARPAAATPSCSVPPDAASTPISFSDATDAVGVRQPLTGMYVHAVAHGDVNDDGWPDLFVGSFGDGAAAQYQQRGATGPAPDRLLLGGPAGYRVDADFPVLRGRTSGALFADLDGDDDVDLVVGRNPRGSSGVAAAPSVVLPNDGSGRFGPPVVLSTTLGARSITVLDHDEDGRPDLFVASDRWDKHPGSALLRNEGGLVFRDATERAQLPGDVRALGAAAADLDQDGTTDLVVAGTRPTGAGSARAVRVFQGVPGGTYREVDAGVPHWPTNTNEDDAAAVTAADLDRDGRPELVVGQHYGSTVTYSGTGPSQTGTMTGATGTVRLYRPTTEGGRLALQDITAAAGLGDVPTKAPDVQVADLDNDGWPDLLTSASRDGGSRPTVLQHQGLGADGLPRFASSQAAGTAQYWVAGPLADIDRDGRQEPLLGEWFARLPSVQLRNETPSGHWLRVRVLPRAPLYGSTVAVYCAGGLGQAGALVAQAVVQPGTGYAAGTEAVPHLGLGGLTEVDVRVTTPDGAVTDARGVSADQELVVRPQLAPSPVLLAAPASSTTGLEVRFDASRSLAPTSPLRAWELDPGDGTPAHVGQGAPPADLVHAYASPGDWQAALRVTDATGMTAATTVPVVVADPLAAPLSLVLTPPRGLAPLEAGWTASVGPGGEQPAGWTLDRGDGSLLLHGTGTPTSGTHRYGLGSWTAVLSTTTTGGRNASATRTVVVGAPHVPPSARVSVSTKTGTAPLTLTVTGSATRGDAALTGQTTTVGDGGAVAGSSRKVVLRDLGTYPVTAAVTDASAMTARAATSVVVRAPDPLAATLTPSSQVRGKAVRVVSTGFGGAEPLRVTLDGSLLKSATSTALGGSTVDVVVPKTAALGARTVTVSGTVSGRSVSAVLQVG